MFREEIYQADQEARGVELREEQERELKKREQLKLSIDKAIVDVINVDIASGNPPTGYITKDLEVFKSHLAPHLIGADNVFAKKSGKLIRDIIYDDGTGTMVTEGVKEGLAVDELIAYLEAKISQTPPPANLTDIQVIKDLLVANCDIYSNLHADISGDRDPGTGEPIKKLKGRILTDGYLIGKNRAVEYESNGLDAKHIRENPDTSIQGSPNSTDPVIIQKKTDADYFRGLNLIAGDERKELKLKELDLDTLRRSLNEAKVAEFLKAQGVTDIVNNAQFKQAVYAEMWEILNKEKESYPILEGIIKKFKDGADSSTLTAEFTNLAQKMGLKDVTGLTAPNRVKQIYDSLNDLIKVQAAQNIKKCKQTKNLIVSGILAAGGIGVGICALPIFGAGAALIGAGTAMYTGFGISGARIGKSIIDWLGLGKKKIEKEVQKIRGKIVDTGGALTIDNTALSEKKVNYECGLEFAKHFAARLAQEKQRDIDGLFEQAGAPGRPVDLGEFKTARENYLNKLEAKGLKKFRPAKRQRIIEDTRNVTGATEYQAFGDALGKQRTAYAKEVVDFLKERYSDMSDEEIKEYAIAVAVYYEMTERGGLEIAEYENLGIKGLLEGLYDSKIGKLMSAGGGGSEKERMANGLALTVGGALIRAGKFYFKAKHGTLAEIVNWTTNVGGRVLMSHGFGLGARGLTEFAKREALATITYENFRKADSEEKKQAILAKGEALLRDKERVIKKDGSARTALEHVAEEVEKMRQYFIIFANDIQTRLAEDVANSIDTAGNFTTVDISKVNEVLLMEDKFKQAGEAYRKKEKAGRAVRRNDIAARLLGLVAFDIGEQIVKHWPSRPEKAPTIAPVSPEEEPTPEVEVIEPVPVPKIPSQDSIDKRIEELMTAYRYRHPNIEDPHGGIFADLGQKLGEHEVAEIIDRLPVTINSSDEVSFDIVVNGHNHNISFVPNNLKDFPGYLEKTPWGIAKYAIIKAIVEDAYKNAKIDIDKQEDWLGFLSRLKDEDITVVKFGGNVLATETVEAVGRVGGEREVIPQETTGAGAGSDIGEDVEQAKDLEAAGGVIPPVATPDSGEAGTIPIEYTDEGNVAPAPEPALDIQTIEPYNVAPQTNADKFLQNEYFNHLLDNQKSPNAHLGWTGDKIDAVDDQGVLYNPTIGYQQKDGKLLLDLDNDGFPDAEGKVMEDNQQLQVEKIFAYTEGKEEPDVLDLTNQKALDDNLEFLADRIGGDYQKANDTLSYLRTGDKSLLFCGNNQIEAPAGAEVARLVPNVKGDAVLPEFSWSLEREGIDNKFDGFVFWDQQNGKGVAVLDVNQTGVPRSWQIEGGSINQALQKIDNNPVLDVEKLQENFREVFGDGEVPQTAAPDQPQEAPKPDAPPAETQSPADALPQALKKFKDPTQWGNQDERMQAGEDLLTCLDGEIKEAATDENKKVYQYSKGQVEMILQRLRNSE